VNLWRRWWRRETLERQLDAELRDHVERLVEEHVASGMSEAGARRRARIEFGGLEQIKERTRDATGLNLVDEISRDLKYAMRSLARTPGFSCIAILTLAFGIGANTAICSVIDAVLIRPLPYPQSERLAMAWEEASRFGFPRNDVAPGNYVDWERESRVFEDLAAFSGNAFNLTGSGQPERLDGVQATPNLFPLLGVKPLLGRWFLPSEGTAGNTGVVLLSHTLWQRRFGGDAGVVGRAIVLSRRPYVIVGVMPRGFQFPNESTQLWIPIAFAPDARRDSHFLRVVGRLRTGRSLTEAEAELQAIAARLAAAYPATNESYGATVVPLQEEFVRNSSVSLWLLEASALLVLVVACGNVAGLLITRGIGRRQEIAVRSALGASRQRIVRQLLIEGLTLAMLGGAGGVLLAGATFRWLEILIPPALRGSVAPSLDWRMLTLGLIVSLLSGAVCGLAPLRVASNASLARDMAGRGTARRPDRFRPFLVSAQVAIALVVVTSAGLLIRTIANLKEVDPGFQAENVLTARLEVSTAGTSALDRRKRFYRDVVERIETIPGVVSAGFTTFLPYTNFGGSSTLYLEDRADLPDGSQFAYRREVTPAYLPTIGVPLIAGRGFTELDDLAHPLVVIVNQYIADLIGRDAIGRRIKFGEVDGPWLTIVGVAGNIREEGLETPVKKGTVYLPVAQSSEVSYFNPRDLAVRVSGNPSGFVAALEREVWSIDKDQTVSNVRTMDAIVNRQITTRTVQTALLTTFAGLVLFLAALGVYGLLSYVVSARTNEFGLRMALGADRGNLAMFVARRALFWVASGAAAGTAMTLVTSRSLTGLLYGVTPLDPATLVAAIVTLCAVGVLASLIPVWRATRVDPVTALRFD
jgi:predicted permease